MRIPTDPREKEQLLNKLREAVAFQIRLWDAATSISEAIDCELERVLNHVAGSAIVADDGTELTHEDLNDLLGIGVPGRVIEGKPLKSVEYGPRCGGRPHPPDVRCRRFTGTMPDPCRRACHPYTTPQSLRRRLAADQTAAPCRAMEDQ